MSGLIGVEHANLIFGSGARRRAIPQAAGACPGFGYPLKSSFIRRVYDVPVHAPSVLRAGFPRLVVGDTEGKRAKCDPLRPRYGPLVMVVVLWPSVMLVGLRSAPEGEYG